MGISEETAGVGNDLADMEASSIVSASSVVGSDKEGSSQAAIGHTAVVRAPWVGECKAWWASSALGTLVDVSSGNGR